jgi:hypothetical protein
MGVWIGQLNGNCATASPEDSVFVWMVEHCRSAPDKRMVLVLDEMEPRRDDAHNSNNDGAAFLTKWTRESPLHAQTPTEFARSMCGHASSSASVLRNFRVLRMPYDVTLFVGMDGHKISTGTWAVLFGGTTAEQTTRELDLPVTDTVCRFMSEILLFLCGQGAYDDRVHGFMTRAFTEMGITLASRTFAEEWKRADLPGQATAAGVASMFTELSLNVTVSTREWLTHAMTCDGAKTYVSRVYNAARLIAVFDHQPGAAKAFNASRLVYLSQTLPVYLQGVSSIDAEKAMQALSTEPEKEALRKDVVSKRYGKTLGKVDVNFVHLVPPVIFFALGDSGMYIPNTYRVDAYETLATEVLPVVHLDVSLRIHRGWFRSIPVYRERVDTSVSNVKTVTGVKGICNIEGMYGRTVQLFGESHISTGLLCEAASKTHMQANEYLLHDILNHPDTCYDVMYEQEYKHFNILEGGGDTPHIHLSFAQTITGTRKFWSALCGDDHRRCGVENVRVHYWDIRQLKSTRGESWTHPYEVLVQTKEHRLRVRNELDIGDTENPNHRQNFVALVRHLCGFEHNGNIQSKLDKLYAEANIDPDHTQVDEFCRMFRKRLQKVDPAVNGALLLELYAYCVIHTQSDIVYAIYLMIWTDVYAMLRMFTQFEHKRGAHTVAGCKGEHSMQHIKYYAGWLHTKNMFMVLVAYCVKEKLNATFKYEEGGTNECTDMPQEAMEAPQPGDTTFDTMGNVVRGTQARQVA